ncbi:MAG: hypothetical protein NC318_09475 [Blautia sp.]|nr:hypothetical protein [Blautia sp.]
MGIVLARNGRADRNPAKARFRSVKNAAVLGLKAARAAFSPSAGVFQGPSWDFCLPCRGCNERRILLMRKFIRYAGVMWKRVGKLLAERF